MPINVVETKRDSFAHAGDKLLRGFLCFALAGFGLAVAGAVAAFGPERAFAEDIDTDPVADEYQQAIEESSQAYNEATAKIAELEQQISDNDAAIAELQEKLPSQKERASDAVVEIYKSQQDTASIIDIVLSSSSFSDFITRIDYFNSITRAYLSEIESLAAMQDELTETQANLEASKQEVSEQAESAQQALEAAQAARVEAQRKAAEEARQQAEAAAAAQAAEEAAKTESKTTEEQSKSDSSNSSSGAETSTSDTNNASGATETISGSTASDTDTADWTSDEDAFISEWTKRINNYLAGSPLAGQGEAFARAAWNYGVDPRWSPAISYVESSKGAACFMPHNAWGWGSCSWDSWEEAINDHVRGLARGYGYTLTYANAQKYCPPNADHWYNTCLEQMNLI